MFSQSEKERKEGKGSTSNREMTRVGSVSSTTPSPASPSDIPTSSTNKSRSNVVTSFDALSISSVRIHLYSFHFPLVLRFPFLVSQFIFLHFSSFFLYPLLLPFFFIFYVYIFFLIVFAFAGG